MSNPSLMNRRGILKGSAAALGGALLSGEPMEAYPKGVNTNSSPSALRITDLRVATVVKPGPSPCPIIRIDTNQGVYGLGEVRDGASATYALMLKSRILGENPLQVDRHLPQDQAIRRTGAPGGRRLRAWKWPCGTLRARFTTCPSTSCWAARFATRSASTPTPRSPRIPKVYAQRMKERKEVMGLTWLKMDLGVEMVADKPGTVTVRSGLSEWEKTEVPHPLLAMEVTDKGIALLEEYVAAVRDAVGMEIPLSMDHLGHLGVKSIIRLGKAYEKYNLSWMEDVIPWEYDRPAQADLRPEPHAHPDGRGYLPQGRLPGSL